MKYAAYLMIALLLWMGGLAPAAGAEEVNAPSVYYLEIREGAGNSRVCYPVLTANSISADRINRQIMEEARIEQYLMLLGSLSGNGTGLKMDCEVNAGQRYLSVLLTAEGKMLSGPPGKAYYPMVFDMETGSRVQLEELFTDPEQAIAMMETILSEDIQPKLSSYLENSELFPLPSERFLITENQLIFYYEKNRLSFLSGAPGAVAFRFSELWDVLKKTDDSVLRDLTKEEAYEAFWSSSFDRAALQETLCGKGVIAGIEGLSLGEDLDTVLKTYSSTTDSGYYPGGECYEVEDARLRGAWILTDEEGDQVTGILSGWVDSAGIETGKTTLAHAAELLGEPQSRMSLDPDTAETYLVCPGTVLKYDTIVRARQPETGEETLIPAEYLLFGDEAGIVQYIQLSLKQTFERTL